MSFKAFRIHQEGKDVRVGFEQLEIDDLTEGNVVIKVHYSDINYKDALAATGTARILRADALNGGIDLAGVVTSSESDRFSVVGDSRWRLFRVRPYTLRQYRPASRRADTP